MELLEREAALAQLIGLAERSRAGDGQLALVAGGSAGTPLDIGQLAGLHDGLASEPSLIDRCGDPATTVCERVLAMTASPANRLTPLISTTYRPCWPRRAPGPASPP